MPRRMRKTKSYLWENKIIVGTRGWSEQEEKPEKIIKRENARLALALEDGVKKFGTDKEIIVCMHYPPFNNFEQIEQEYIDALKLRKENSEVM